VAAHSNQSRHGKAKALKASDIYIASLCARCHSALDQGYHMDKQQKIDMWEKAHRKTVNMLVFFETWPRGVPVPEL
jgi:cytochrome c553